MLTRNEARVVAFGLQLPLALLALQAYWVADHTPPTWVGVAAGMSSAFGVSVAVVVGRRLGRSSAPEDEQARLRQVAPAVVGTVIPKWATDIHPDVTAVETRDGNVWRRAVTDRERCHDGGQWEWVTLGGWATTRALLDGAAPLRVIRVREQGVR